MAPRKGWVKSLVKLGRNFSRNRYIDLEKEKRSNQKGRAFEGPRPE